jgi:acetyltransferase-like isoleucine patch superfamily enzyme
LSSSERRAALVARARAEAALRLARARGQDIEWSGGPLFYEGWPIFRAEGRISLGDDCRLRGGPVRTRLITRPEGRIVFGDRVGVNFGSEITSECLVTIGDDTALGPYVTIYDTSFHAVSEGEDVKSAPVAIQSNVWVGRQVLILPGVTIGDHSVVASYSVVSRDVPARTLVAGNPARPVREVSASDGWRRM